MPHSNIYLQYKENRIESDEDDSDEIYDRDPDDEFEDAQESIYGDISDRVFVEFIPIKLTIEEPRGDSIELELNFEASSGDELHMIVIRFNSYNEGVFDDWCVESVYLTLEEAEERAEAIEELSIAADCADERSDDPVILKAEVFSLPLKKK
jgi:hypothetical protein